jgi:cytochrome b6
MARESRILGWFGQFRADVKASTDAGLLAVTRWFGILYGPIDRRLPIDQAWRKSRSYRLPSHIRWKHALGSIAYLLFILLVVTGVLLSFYYRPSIQEAYPSLQHIVSNVSMGWLMRDMHVWTASLIVLVILLHMARVFIDVAYKPPRETNWLAGMLLLLVVLAFGATGHLLAWDQWAYWSTTEVLATYEEIPVFGPLLTDLLTGDVVVSGATLSRFFALHVIVLPWVAFALLAFHFGLLRRHGIAPPVRAAPSDAVGRRFYPAHLLRSLITAVLVVGFVMTAAIMFPRPHAEIANPYVVPSDLEVTWAPASIGLAVVRHLGHWGVIAFLAVGLGFAMLPLCARGPERRITRKPVALLLGFALVAALAWAWIAGSRIDTVAPDAAPAVEGSASPAAGDAGETQPTSPEAADTGGTSPGGVP